MAAAVVAWRGSSPDAIETDLAALWREAAREGPVARALMSNLVVVREHRSGSAGVGEAAIVEVAQRHPVRAILLDYTRGIPTACAPEAPRVGLVTFGTPPLRYGVELMAIHAACAESSIPSIVRRLVRGDVPTTIWWTGDLSERSAPHAMTTIGRQFVCDSGSWRDARKGIRSVADLLAQPPRRTLRT